MAKYYLNGNLTDTTPALDTVLSELDAASKIVKDARNEAEAQKAADKQSAHDKLSALGLTDAEIEAIT